MQQAGLMLQIMPPFPPPYLITHTHTHMLSQSSVEQKGSGQGGWKQRGEGVLSSYLGAAASFCPN